MLFNVSREALCLFRPYYDKIFQSDHHLSSNRHSKYFVFLAYSQDPIESSTTSYPYLHSSPKGDFPKNIHSSVRNIIRPYFLLKCPKVLFFVPHAKPPIVVVGGRYESSLSLGPSILLLCKVECLSMIADR